MTAVEDRLQAAARAVNATIPDDSAPPLRLPPPDLRRRPSRVRMRRRGMARWAAPLAAAAAVAGIIAVSVVLGTGTSAPPEAGPQNSQHPRRLAPPESPQAVRDELAKVPPYYIALLPTHRYGQGPYEALIQETATGVMVARFSAPAPYNTFVAVTGAADDRTFVLAARDSWSTTFTPTAFYRAQFDPATRKVTVTPLPIPAFPAKDLPTGLALSPDGTRLAIATADGQLGVYSMATGSATIWRSPGTIGGGEFDTVSVSWSDSGTLAFNWISKGNRSVRLLNTGTRGGSLLGDSRLAVTEKRTRPLTFNGSGILTPDGTKIVAPMSPSVRTSQAVPSSSPPMATSEFAEYSTATGRLLRVLYRQNTASEVLVWSNSTGSVLVVAAPVISGQPPVAGVLDGRLFTPMPRAPWGAGLVSTMYF